MASVLAARSSEDASPRKMSASVNPHSATVSACFIVRDGAETIGRAIASVRPHVDEVCIVDTGSADKTLEVVAEIAAQPGAPVVVEQMPWHDDFAAARTRSFDIASSEYAMALDDDDVLEGGARLREQISQSLDVLAIQRVCIWSSDQASWFMQNKVIRRSLARWASPIHERLLFPDSARRGIACPSALRIVHHPLRQPGRHDFHRDAVDRWMRHQPTPYLRYYLGCHLLREDRDPATAAVELERAIRDGLTDGFSELAWIIGAARELSEAYAELRDRDGFLRSARMHSQLTRRFHDDPVNRECDRLTDEYPVGGDDHIWAMYADDPRTIGAAF